MDNLDAVVQEKIDSDADFQASLADLTEEEQETAINAKKSEVTNVVFKELADAKAKAEQIAKDQKLRAEKAEKAHKGGQDNEPKEQGLSTKDTIALMNAKVHEDDIDDVLDYAKYKGISVAEALKSSVIKASLAEKEEFRKTALATTTGTKRQGTVKIDPQTLISDLKAGKVPAKGSKEAEELFWAKNGGRR